MTVIMRAARCGHHFYGDCVYCVTAKDVTDNELDELRATIAAAEARGAEKDATIARLVAAAKNAREDLAMAANVGFADPAIRNELQALCERVGYGSVMATASVLWREIAEVKGSEFCAGPCRKVAESAVEQIDQALAALGEQP